MIKIKIKKSHLNVREDLDYQRGTQGFALLRRLGLFRVLNFELYYFLPGLGKNGYFGHWQIFFRGHFQNLLFFGGLQNSPYFWGLCKNRV